MDIAKLCHYKNSAGGDSAPCFHLRCCCYNSLEGLIFLCEEALQRLWLSILLCPKRREREAEALFDQQEEAVMLKGFLRTFAMRSRPETGSSG